MRISDWSSDVCSSDLRSRTVPTAPRAVSVAVEALPRTVPTAPREVWPTKSVPTACASRLPLPEAEPEPVALPPTVRPSRSEEHKSEHQSLMRNSYDVFCLKKKKNNTPKKLTKQKHKVMRA